MAKRRHFVGAALVSALLCLGLWRLFHWPAHIAPDAAQNLVRVWLAADYRQAGQDPLLRAPADPNAMPSAGAEETSPIAFTEFLTDIQNCLQKIQARALRCPCVSTCRLPRPARNSG